MTEETHERVTAAPSRRGALGIAGLAGIGAVGVVTLSACGSSGDDDASSAQVPPKIKGKVIAKKSDIPVGGGKVFEDTKVVVTQPTKGDFKAFTAVCTHKGCTVGDVQNGVIECPCHGSEFSAADGSVKQGPATTKLPEFTVKMKDDGITLV